jgi:5-enolpyruvylshikimate-3-phosphate synthase
MTRAQAFPALLIVLDVCAACVYAVEADVRRAVYWAAAAVLTAAVTF